MKTPTQTTSAEVFTFPPERIRKPAEIIPFPHRPRRSRPVPRDAFEIELASMNSIFEQSCQKREDVRFEICIPSQLFGALITESAAFRFNVFRMAEQFLRLGLDRFDAEGLIWTNQPPDAPGNLIPLRFIRDVVKYDEDAAPFSA